MALPPFDPTNPIPNNPFYYPQTASLTGPDGPLIVGDGLQISSTGVISATGTTTTGVSSLLAGPGIFLTGSTGDIAISNTGVLDIEAGLGITVSANTGVITISADDHGTVTSVGAGYGLQVFGSAAPITTSGVLELSDTGVVAAVYNYPSALQVDEKGRILSITSGTNVSSVSGASPINSTGGSNPTISIDPATTAQRGAVQLSDSVSSSSSATAATSLAVQTAYSLAGQGVPKTTLSAAGSLITASIPNTPAELTVGGDGQILMADSTDPLGIKWADNDEGTVTLINTGTGLTGGPIDVTGTISLANTAVTPGNYTYASFSVDAQGRIYAASNGVDPVTAVTGTAPIQVSAGTTPVVSIDPATTLAAGAVQLYDGTDSTSVALALTAAAGKSLQDQIDELDNLSNLVFAGTLDCSTGLMATVTQQASNVGFAVGGALPASAANNAEFFVIVTVPGLYTPPGGTQVNAHQGDWFRSTGTAWEFYDVGIEVLNATTTNAGIVRLSTDAETQAGTDATIAVTPASLQSKISDSIATTSSTTIASSSAVKDAYDLAAAAIPQSEFTNAGEILTGTGVGTYTALPVGTDGNVLIADSACTGGLKWAVNDQGTVTEIIAGTGLDGGTITASGTISLANTSVTPGSYTYSTVVVDAQGRLTSASNGADPLPLTGGTMTGNIAFQNLGDGLSFQGTANLLGITDLVNVTDSEIAASATAVKTAYDAAVAAGSGSIPATAFTAKGEILAATGNGVYAPLPGTASGVPDGKVLSTNSLASTGIAWIDPPVTGVASLTSGSLALIISNSNPGPDDLIITARNAGIGISGVVELNNDELSTSLVTAPTSRVANLAYQTAQDAVVNALQGGLTSNYIAYVSANNGNDVTGQYGTTLAYATISEALLQRGISESTIFIAPGTYTEDLLIQTGTGVHLVGLNAEGQIGEGVEIVGTVYIQYTGAGSGGDTTFTGIKFREPGIVTPNATIQVDGTSQTFGEITFNDCYIQRTYGTDPTQQWAFEGTGTWSVPVNFNNCLINGSIKMGAGAADGSGGELILRNCSGFSVNDYITLETGTVKVLDTPGYLCPIKQTGGIVEVSGVGSGILPSGAALNTIFGGQGYSYQGTAASVGNGLIEFIGSVPAQGIVEIGTNVQYGLGGLTISLANLNLISTDPIYVPGTSDLTILQSAYLQSEQLTTANALLTGSPDDQYAIVAKQDGTINRVSNFDAGTY